jgi:hypothetical protein
MSNPALAIPRKISDITPDWLSDALRSSGALGTARVIEIAPVALGEGEGFIGQLARLHLRYDVDEADAPRTVIAKLPTLVRQNRMMGELLGAYEREVYFYRELAAKLPSRIPRVYYADMGVNPLSDHSVRILAWIDRRPTWMMAILIVFLAVVARFSRRRYALVLEDLAPAEVGNQIGGASQERCRAALQELARLHARFWQNSDLDAHFWLVPQDVAVNSVHLMYRRARPDFARRYVTRHPELRPYLAWLDDHASDLMRLFHGAPHHTLIHMDYRLDNLFFYEDGIAIFDWQTVSRGPGVYDAAYFLSGALTADFGVESEHELTVAYHAALVACGVRDYPLDRCLIDYRRAMMLNLYRLATVGVMDMGDERGADLIDGWIARLSSRIGGIDLDKLL